MSFLDQYTAVLISYNSKAVLSVSISPFYQKLKIIVVDNASSDGTVDFLRSNFPEIEIIENKQNLGFGSGFNVALGVINTKYVIALNPDSEFSVNKLAELHEHAERYLNAAVLSPKLHVPPNGEEIWVMGPSELNHSRATFAPDGPFSSWFASAAVCIFRTEMLQQIGGFDQNIFLYNEDLDLCIRLRAAGYEIINIPNVVALHLNSLSVPRTKRMHWRKDWNFAWSHLYVLNKFSGRWSMYWSATNILITRIPKALFYFVIFQQKRFVRDAATTMGCLSFLLGISPFPKN